MCSIIDIVNVRYFINYCAALVQGHVVSMRGTVIRELQYDPTYDKPAYEGEAQLPGPGFASFKPYLRPYYFRIRVCYYTC